MHTLRIEIFIVTSKLNETTKKKLEKQKIELIKLFKGLTVVSKISKGYWINPHTRKTEFDLVQIWLIYTEHLNLELCKEFQYILFKIKGITKQTSQAYAVNHKLYFL